MDRIESHLGNDRIREVLELLGRELRADVEMLIVGGAAALLTGLLPPVVTTEDVDAMQFRPSQETEAVLLAAQALADKQGIARGWLNLDAGLFAYSLPEGWERRRVEIGTYGRLRVWAAGRFDLIAMKFFAHRTVDLGHLARLSISRQELNGVAEYLKKMGEELPAVRSRAEMAARLVAEWEPAT